jgi:mannose-6-phosphate isomerase-like protein (cupin superfamily)
MSDFQRRDFLTGAAALAAATSVTLVGSRRATANDKPSQPIRGQKGAPIIGPTNPAHEAQNLDRLSPPPTDHGTMPNLSFSIADCHNRLQPGGWARQVAGRELQTAQALNCVNMRLKAGAVREMRWHANPDELQYHVEGQSRMRVYASGSAAGTFDYQPGDVAYVPKSMPHYIENTGTTTLRYLELWRSDHFADVSLAQWLAFTPYELVRAHLKIDKSILAKVPTKKTPVVPV